MKAISNIRFSLATILAIIALGLLIGWAAPFSVSIADGVSFVTDKVFACCGGDGGDTGEGGGDKGHDKEPREPQKLQPVCVLQIDKQEIKKGEKVTLFWTTTNAQFVTLEPFGPVNFAGTRTHEPTQDTTYVLMGRNNTQRAEVICTASVKVKEPVPAPHCKFLKASPTEFPHGGGHTTLTWETVNGVSAEINHGVGTVSLSGSKQVFVDSSRTFTLTVKNSKGEIDQCSDNVGVKPKPKPEPKPVKCELDVSPNEVKKGSKVTVTWSTQNAKTVTVQPFFGTEPASGSRPATINEDTTVVLTAKGVDGDTVVCKDTVKVKKEEPKKKVKKETNVTKDVDITNTNTNTNNGDQNINNNVNNNVVGNNNVVTNNTNISNTINNFPGTTNSVNPTCTISASPASIDKGSSATLTWSSNHATAASITTIGSVQTSGSRSVSPSVSTTYVMVVTGPGGSNTCSTHVQVADTPASGLSCTISASPSTIGNNGSSTLFWSSTGATSAALSDGIGAVSTSGSLTVWPESSRMYTLTVRDSQNNTRTCSATVSVSGTTSVSLTQVPYTGVTDSVASLAYWLGLIGWAGAAGFISFAYRGDITTVTATALRRKRF